jgi:hypothetical protein
MGTIRDFFHPREAAARSYREQEEEPDRQVQADIEEYERNADSDRWAGRYPQKGNPPKSRALEWEIDRYSEQYPEVSSLEMEQEEICRETHERGPNWSYPEYEGPGITEPPVDWEGWHHDHTGWTFTEWAEEHNYADELIDEINHQFPPDPREIEYPRRRDEQWQAEEREWEEGPEGEEADPGAYDDLRGLAGNIQGILRERYGAEGIDTWQMSGQPGSPELEAAGPQAEPPWLLRIVTMEKGPDGAWESPGHREIRGEPDPYDPSHLPDYSYGAPGREAAE